MSPWTSFPAIDQPPGRPTGWHWSHGAYRPRSAGSRPRRLTALLPATGQLSTTLSTNLIRASGAFEAVTELIVESFPGLLQRRRRPPGGPYPLGPDFGPTRRPTTRSNGAPTATPVTMAATVPARGAAAIPSPHQGVRT